MSQTPNAPPCDESQFHGPAEVADAWRKFVDAHTGHGMSTFDLRGAALLDEIAFNGGTAALVKETAGIGESFANAKAALESAARALSRATQDPNMRALHRAVTAALLTQWRAAIDRAGNGSSECVAYTRHTARSPARREEVQARRAAILGQVGPALVAGAIQAAHEYAIHTEAVRVHRQVRQTVSLDDILERANDRFYHSLFSWTPMGGASFTSHLINSLHFLDYDARRLYLQSKRGHTSLDAAGNNGVQLADESSTNLLAGVLLREEIKKLPGALSGLSITQRRILGLRYGFEDGENHTQSEVAAKLGITRQWVYQLEKAALAKCRKVLDAQQRNR